LHARVMALDTDLRSDLRKPMGLLLGAAALAVLIACVNVANLFLVRGVARRREIAVRFALGASRGRLLRQSVTEGAVMSVAGGILGLWLAAAGVQALIHAYPASVPRMSQLTIDLPVLLLALGLSAGTALLFGFVSLGRRRTGSMAAALKEGARGSSGAWRHYTRRGLVIAQVAFALMLVIGAGLLVQTVYNLTRIDPGFDRSRLATFSMTLPMANSEPETRAQAYKRILDKLRAVPGVLGTVAMSGLPPVRTPDAIVTPIENYTSDDGKHSETIDYYQFVMGDYFATMGIPIVAGRGFEPTDYASQGKVVIVNETLAKRIWKGQNPLGQRLRPPGGSFGADGDIWHTVIGVARDVRQRGVDMAAGTELYVSLDQHRVSPPSMNVVMRTTLPTAALSGTIERLVREVDAAVPVVRLRNMEFRTFLQTRSRLEYRGLARSGWIGDYMDPFTFLSMYVIEGGENGSGWSDPKFERLLSDANKQHDPDVRYRMLAEAEALLLRAQPTMPLYNNATNFVKKPFVKGMYANPVTMHPWKFVYIEHDPSKWD